MPSPEQREEGVHVPLVVRRELLRQYRCLEGHVLLHRHLRVPKEGQELLDQGVGVAVGADEEEEVHHAAADGGVLVSQRAEEEGLGGGKGGGEGDGEGEGEGEGGGGGGIEGGNEGEG